MNLNLYEHTSIHDLIDSQTDRCPQAVALVCGDQHMTYQELDARANQLAHHLKILGVRPEMLVGICTTRSLEMVVGILGILKAGGAYVPLDPSYPPERLAFVLEDARAEFVVTQDQFLEMFCNRHVRTVSLDGDWSGISHQPSHRPASGACPENLAYVIYTSGSTGKPKGVMITHSNLCHFVRIACSALDVTPRDVYLQTASIAYALSVRQLMVPLAWGATIVMATSAEVRDPLALFELIKRWNITLMDMVPSFWRSCIQRLMELPSSEARELLNNSLRRIVSIGEALAYDLPHEWTSRLGHQATLVNIFGQTETTGVVATYEIPREAPGSSSVVPIGRSVTDTRLYILDAELKPVQAGEQGELCVSNPCLARGYLNRPELTAEKFIPNLFGDGLSERLYRTGDMARMNDNGDIEFLGRGDHQVKIRGQRLELGEVEALIREHPSVKDCVVTARRNLRDENYLAAYIVPVAGQALEISKLRECIRSKAPDYMIPSTFMVMDALPLTPNGKLDRLALPDPLTAGFSQQTAHEPPAEPSSHIEQRITGIWKELMESEHVGVHENFFDLGGHSLTAVRLFSRLEQEFGIRLPTMTIFQAPTIARLAEHLTNREAALDSHVLVPIQTHGERPPFFCVHGVGGGVLGYRDLAVLLGDDQPFYALQSIGLENPGIHDLSIEDMASRYMGAMRSIQPNGPYRIGGYCFGGVVAYEMACQLEKLGEQVSLLAIFEGYVPNAKPRSASFPTRFVFFLQSIPQWIKDYARMGPGELRRRTLSTFRKAWAKLWRRQELARQARLETILDTDLGRVPTRNIELTQVNSNALHSYQPKKYGGKITLFWARNRTFNEVVFGSLDPKMGWGDLAKDGVIVKMVDGFHRNIHMRPYVSSLAAELRHSLADE